MTDDVVGKTVLITGAVLMFAGCGATPAPMATVESSVGPPSSASSLPSASITVWAACGVRQVAAMGALWDASPPYETVVLPAGVSSPFLAPPPGMTAADPRYVEEVPARFTLVGPDSARLDSPRLARPVLLSRVPDGAPASMCMP